MNTDLRAASAPGVDHAYYLALSIGAETALTWTHNNGVAKAEAWRICLTRPGPSQIIPLLPEWGVLAAGLLLLGTLVLFRPAILRSH